MGWGEHDFPPPMMMKSHSKQLFIFRLLCVVFGALLFNAYKWLLRLRSTWGGRFYDFKDSVVLLLTMNSDRSIQNRICYKSPRRSHIQWVHWIFYCVIPFWSCIAYRVACYCISYLGLHFKSFGSCSKSGMFHTGSRQGMATSMNVSIFSPLPAGAGKDRTWLYHSKPWTTSTKQCPTNQPQWARTRAHPTELCLIESESETLSNGKSDTQENVPIASRSAPLGILISDFSSTL